MSRLILASKSSFTRKPRRNTPSSSGYPAWRANKTIGQVYSISGTENVSGYTMNSPAPTGADPLVRPWIGYAADLDNSRWFIVTGGGHATSCLQDWQNPILKFDFMQDAPSWVSIDDGSISSKASARKYYDDGRVQAVHTYFCPRYVGPGKMADGKERLFRFGPSAGYGQSLPSECDDPVNRWAGGPDVQGYLLNPSDWFAHNTYDGSVHGWELDGAHPNVPNWGSFSAFHAILGIAQDPTTHDVYTTGLDGVGYYTAHKWTASTDSWSTALATSETQAEMRGAGTRPALFDSIRGRIVQLWDFDGSPRLVCTPVTAPHTISTITLSGESFTHSYAGFVHDTDNDRYIASHVVGLVPKLWAINPTTGVVTELAAFASITSNGASGWLGKLMFLPNLHCLVFLNDLQETVGFIPTA